MSKYPNRIAEIRNSKGWSQKKLAAGARTSIGQINNLEKGTRRLTHDWMKRISEPLGVSPEELIKETNIIPIKGLISVSGVVLSHQNNTTGRVEQMTNCPSGLNPETAQAYNLENPVKDSLYRYEVFFDEAEDGLPSQFIGAQCKLDIHPASPTRAGECLYGYVIEDKRPNYCALRTLEGELYKDLRVKSSAIMYKMSLKE